MFDTTTTAPTELQRPLPYRAVQKNCFIFWDIDSHRRSDPSFIIAALRASRYRPRVHVRAAQYRRGRGARPRATAALTDETCLRKLFPPLPSLAAVPGGDSESLHRATNALSITLCARGDGSTYEPYTMLFRAAPPFEVYGLSAKPLWISGRGTPPPPSASASTAW
ncbi:hypothetical protein BJX65DRAFT_312033 [Aspergillus insuetus]